MTDLPPEGPELNEEKTDWYLKSVFQWHALNTTGDLEPIDLTKFPNAFAELRLAHDRFEEGNWLSLLDALRVCQELDVPLPNWVKEGLSAFIIDAVNGIGKGKKGRGNTPIAKTRNSLKRLKRFDTVERIREAQKSKAGGNQFIYGLMLPNETKQAINEGKIASIGTTFDDAVAAAELSLRGTFAQASFATIAINYRNYKEDEFVVSHATQVALGLAIDDLPPKFQGIDFSSSESWSEGGDIK